MSRSTQIAALMAATLIVAVAGTVLATRAPSAGRQPTTADEAHEPEGADAIAHASDRLAEAGIEIDVAVLEELAAAYGVGGAVRVAGWAGADEGDDITVESIRAMRDGDGTEGSGMGWGQIARALGVHPGLGSIVGHGGGNGHGKPSPAPDAAP
jgi:hypothetical protein